MSARLFLAYFLALAACATVAFASSEAAPTESPAAAEAGMIAPPFSVPPVVYFTHTRKLAPKRVQLADAQ